MPHDPRDESARPGAIDGRTAFRDAVRRAFATAARERVRELQLVDVDYEAWPLDDAGVLEALGAWARLPSRRLLMVAARFDALPRLFPRFAAWRRDWSHVVECRATDVEPSQIPTLVLAGPASLHLADAQRWRGHWLATPREVDDWHEVVDVLVQRSEPGFAVNTLGL
ncbi:MAG TPA: hypothetical protein VFQ16_16245 [Burkholderiaceae bacterium]|nr:hypothetical protein [Burkholderiaceae bacterium]